MVILNKAMNKALQKPKVVETFAKLGATPAGGTADAFGTLIKEQVAYWGKVMESPGSRCRNSRLSTSKSLSRKVINACAREQNLGPYFPAGISPASRFRKLRLFRQCVDE